MKVFLQSLMFFTLPMILFMTTTGAMAATIVSAGTGNWSATAWPNTARTGTITTSAASATVTGTGSLFLTEISVGNIIKTTGNVVIGTVLSITSNTLLTLTANAASTNASIAYNVQGIGSGDIAQLSGGNTITVDVAGAVCISLQTNNSAAASPWVLVFNSGSHLIVAGTVTIGGDATHPGSITMTSGGILTCQGLSVSTAGTWTPGTGTVELTATNTLPAAFFTTFNNLTISGGITTTAVGLTINSNLSIADGATFTAAGFALTVTGTTTVGSGTSGNLTISSATGAKTFGGLVTINTGGTWNNSGNSAIIFHGGITNNGTFTAGTGVQTFNTSAQSLTGIFSIPSVTVTTITLTNNGTLSVTSAFSVTSALTQATNATLNIIPNSAPTITTLNATAIGNTVNYGYAGPQTVFAFNYYNLTLSNTSAKALLAGTTTISGNLTLSGTASTTAVVGLTIGGDVIIGAGTTFSAASFTHSIAGNWSRSGTFTAGTSTIIFNGSAVQTITSSTTENFINLTVNNSGAGIQLENAVSVATALTMTQGNIDLNGNALTLGSSVANNGTLAYTAGSMLGTGSFTRWFKAVTIANGSVTGLFPMGTLTNNRPFYVSAPSVSPTTGGTIAVAYTDATTNTTTPTYMDGASTIQVRKDLNWAATTGNGLAGGTYNLDIEGTGYGVIGNITDLRVTLASSIVGLPGANAGTTADPQIHRTGLTLTNLSNTFYIGSVNSVATPLPLTWISFTASVVSGRAKLDWETAAEINNGYFTVQRSKDGATWENIQKVVGSGTSNTVSSYTAYDPDPYAGVSYYRLLQTDLDGKESYSLVVSINMGNVLSAITIYPNPATDNVTIIFATVERYEVTLLNSNGQMMKSPILNTGSSLVLNVSNMTAGIYFIRIRYENSTETRKIEIKK
jgi:Secretion system C-terminal sorting domain